MNKENITSAEYVYDMQGFKGMIKVIMNDSSVFWVPNECPENTDYQEIQAWAAIDGNNITDPGE